MNQPSRINNQNLLRLTSEEVAHLKSQMATLEPGDGMRSQIATASSKRNVRFLPYAFTEHGAIMAASVLNSPKAVEMSVFACPPKPEGRRRMIWPPNPPSRIENRKSPLTHPLRVVSYFQQTRRASAFRGKLKSGGFLLFGPGDVP